MAAVGSLESTLATLTDLVAQENQKTVVLECSGLDLVPPRYQATVKNVAIQLIRNAVVHGVETAAEREQAGKPPNARLHLEFKSDSGQRLRNVVSRRWARIGSGQGPWSRHRQGIVERGRGASSCGIVKRSN